MNENLAKVFHKKRGKVVVHFFFICSSDGPKLEPQHELTKSRLCKSKLECHLGVVCKSQKSFYFFMPTFITYSCGDNEGGEFCLDVGGNVLVVRYHLSGLSVVGVYVLCSAVSL